MFSKFSLQTIVYICVVYNIVFVLICALHASPSYYCYIIYLKNHYPVCRVLKFCYISLKHKSLRIIFYVFELSRFLFPISLFTTFCKTKYKLGSLVLLNQFRKGISCRKHKMKQATNNKNEYMYIRT